MFISKCCCLFELTNISFSLLTDGKYTVSLLSSFYPLARSAQRGRTYCRPLLAPPPSLLHAAFCLLHLNKVKVKGQGQRFKKILITEIT